MRPANKPNDLKQREGKVRTIAARLSDAAKNQFVGRQAELSFLFSAIESDVLPFLVAFIHGPGGIGKSWLINSLVEKVAEDAILLNMDCRDIEPTPEGFLSELAKSLRVEVSAKNLEAIVASLAVSGKRTVPFMGRIGISCHEAPSLSFLLLNII